MKYCCTTAAAIHFLIRAELFPLFYVLFLVTEVLPQLLNRYAQRVCFFNRASILRTARSRGSTAV